MGSWQTDTICVILRSCRDAGVVAVIRLLRQRIGRPYVEGVRGGGRG